jgi:endogenous inhibitor of DNA gyrase (YacG/DUF329 family)
MARPSGGKCPICGKAAQPLYRPFCTRRCADLDLARWLNGAYSAPVVELDEGDLDELERFVEGGDADADEPDESSGDRDQVF